jgi:PIN domain nuclease of toxin-antitoxin system
LGEDFDNRLDGEPFRSLPVTHQRGRLAASLPPLHKDPFDRLRVAQCPLEKMALVTQNKTLSGYDNTLIPACGPS